MLLLCTASKLSPSTTISDRERDAIRKEIVLEERQKALGRAVEDLSIKTEKETQGLKVYLEKEQNRLDTWAAILGILTAIISLFGLIIPFILYQKASETQREVAKNIDSTNKKLEEMEGKQKSSILKADKLREKISLEHDKNMAEIKKIENDIRSRYHANLEALEEKELNMKKDHDDLIEDTKRRTGLFDYLNESVDSLTKMDATLNTAGVQSVLDEINAREVKSNFDIVLKEALQAYRIGDFEKSILAWKKMLIEPNVRGSLLCRVFHFIGLNYIQLSRAYPQNKNNNLHLAISFFSAALSHQPDDALVQFYLAYSFAEVNEKVKAIQAYSTILSISSNVNTLFSVLNNRGNIKRDIQDYPGAMSDYNEAQKLKPNDSGLYANRGLLKVDMGDKVGAMSDYNQSIYLNDKNPIAYNNRGNLNTDIGKHEEAMNDYNISIQISPGYANAYCNRGILKMLINDRNGALKDFEKAIELNPQSAIFFTRRGNLKNLMDDLSGAISDYNKAIELNPQHAETYNSRGNLLITLNQLEEAKDDIERAILLEPSQSMFYDSLGDVYFAMEKWELAFEKYTTAIQKESDQPLYYRNRAKALLALNRVSEAEADETKAAELESTQRRAAS